MELDLYEYIKYTTYDHFTLGDFRRMKVGDTIHAILWDRNFEEMGNIWNKKEEDKRYVPSDMFSDMHYTLTKKDDVSWDITYPFGETNNHPIHVSVSHLPTNWKYMEINKDDHMLHIERDVCKDDKKLPTHWQSKHIHMDDLHDNIEVGWRGPMMLWNILEKKYNDVSVFYPSFPDI